MIVAVDLSSKMLNRLEHRITDPRIIPCHMAAEEFLAEAAGDSDEKFDVVASIAQTTYDYGVTIFRQKPENITQFAVQSGLSVIKNFLYKAQPGSPPYSNPDYQGGFVVAQKPLLETAHMRP